MKRTKNNLQEFNHNQAMYLIDMDMSASLYLEYKKLNKDKNGITRKN